jgi:aspartyl aminopeptidase
VPTDRRTPEKGGKYYITRNDSAIIADTAAVYEALCQQEGIPVQRFVSRSDQRCASTIGPISAGHLDMRSLDVGNPALAVHSIRELCGVLDHIYIKRSFQAFFGA